VELAEFVVFHIVFALKDKTHGRDRTAGEAAVFPSEHDGHPVIVEHQENAVFPAVRGKVLKMASGLELGHTAKIGEGILFTAERVVDGPSSLSLILFDLISDDGKQFGEGIHEVLLVWGERLNPYAAASEL
jgi:hypothetical protein